MTICIKTTSDPDNLVRIEADEVPLPEYHENRFLLVLRKNTKVVAAFELSKLDGWWWSR